MKKIGVGQEWDGSGARVGGEQEWSTAEDSEGRECSAE